MIREPWLAFTYLLLTYCCAGNGKCRVYSNSCLWNTCVGSENIQVVLNPSATSPKRCPHKMKIWENLRWIPKIPLGYVMPNYTWTVILFKSAGWSSSSCDNYNWIWIEREFVGQDNHADYFCRQMKYKMNYIILTHILHLKCVEFVSKFNITIRTYGVFNVT